MGQRTGRIKPPVGAQINWGHPLSRGLVGCWNFNEGSGDRVSDATGKYGAGALVGTTGKPTWETGPHGSQLSLTAANNQYVEVQHNPSYPISIGANGGSPELKNYWTFQVEFYMNSLRNFNGLMCKTTAGPHAVRPFETYVLADGTLRLQFGNSGINPATTLAAGVWYDMVVSQAIHYPNVFPTARLYLNGVLIVEQGGATDWGTDTGGLFFGNRADQVVALDGKITRARLWQARALNDQEVAFLYANPYCFMASSAPDVKLLAALPPAPTFRALYYLRSQGLM